jgi:DNA-binding MarR family transcriptional regulator
VQNVGVDLPINHPRPVRTDAERFAVLMQFFGKQGPSEAYKLKVLGVLFWHWSTDGCYPSQATIADETGIDRRTVCTLLRELEDEGWIRILKGVGKSARGRRYDAYELLLRGADAGSSKRGPTTALLEAHNAVDNAVDNAVPEPLKHVEQRTKNIERENASIDEGRKPRLRPIPADWAPDAEDRAYAKSKGYDAGWIAAQAERFRDRHLHKGTISADWHAAWRTWVQDTPGFTPERHSAPMQRRASNERKTARSLRDLDASW